MLFHEIRADGAWKFVLDLHRCVTVLTGLGPEGQERMAGLIEAALMGRAIDLDALIEVHGDGLDLEGWARLVAGANFDRFELFVRARDVADAIGVVDPTGGGDLAAGVDPPEVRAAPAGAHAPVVGA